MLGQFQINIQKLLHDPVKKLSVRYSKTRHAVPDLPDCIVSDDFTQKLLHLMRFHDLSGGSIGKDILERVSLETLPKNEAERLIHLLHRSKVLRDGKDMVRRKHLTTKYSQAKKRLDLILGQVNAGNDNQELKKEGASLALQLRNTRRISSDQYKSVLYKLQNPPIAKQQQYVL